MRLLEVLRAEARGGVLAELERALGSEPGSPGVDPEELWKLGEEAGYRAEICWSPKGEIGSIDVLFEREEYLQAGAAMAEIAVGGESERGGEYWKYANYPSRSERVEGWVGDLKSYLSERLPEYMMPAAIVELRQLPRTASGKVDRKGLPEPAPGREAHLRGDYEAPVGEIEQRIARIWSEALKVERVGRHDHFFELGGHSLLAVKLIERMRSEGLHSEVRALYATPTLSEFAAATEDIEVIL